MTIPPTVVQRHSGDRGEKCEPNAISVSGTMGSSSGGTSVTSMSDAADELVKTLAGIETRSASFAEAMGTEY